MLFKNSFAILGLASMVLFSSGCELNRTPILIELDNNQAKNVLKCKKAITSNSRKFAAKLHKEHHRCSNTVVDLNLNLEYDLISQAQYDAALANKAERTCERSANKILDASTKLVDNIVKQCTNVEDLILTNPYYGDPLGYQAHRNNLVDLDPDVDIYQNVEDLAGYICIQGVVASEIALYADLPRYNEADELLDPSNADSYVDPRCRFGLLPLPVSFPFPFL